jgi:hypothetical protein
MIISHKHKFIFIKTNKTAGTSLEIALSAICGDDDVITPLAKQDEVYRKYKHYKGPQNYQLNESNSFRAHSPASDIKANINSKVWNSYFKFCFERNPWDKVISHYFWRKSQYNYASISEYFAAGELQKIKTLELYEIDDQLAVDKIFKYEELNVALKFLSHKLMLPNVLKMPLYKSKSNFRPAGSTYQQLLTADEAKLISQHFAKEIALMNYVY